MQDRENLEAKPRKRAGKRLIKLILLVMAVLIVLAFLLLPVFVSSEKGRQIILTRINNAVNGKTDFASLSMGWFEGIKVADFSFNDNTGSISVDVKHIATKPHYSSIFSGSLSLGETVIDEPKVRLSLREPQVSEIPQTEEPVDVKPQLLVLPIERIDLVVNDGNVKVTDSKAGTVELARINSKVDLRPAGQQTKFDINLAVVAQGKQSQVHTQGRIIPAGTKSGWTLKGTSGDIAVEVNDLDLESLAPLFTMAGVDVQAKGVISADIDSQIKDGQLESMSGIVRAENLDITLAELKGDRLKTSSLDMDVKVHREVNTINIDNLSLKSDWAVVNAAGTVPTTLGAFNEFIKPDSAYELKADFDFDLPAVSSQMPHTLGLKEGMQITSGRLKGDIEKITEAGRRTIQGRATLSGLEGSVDGKTVALSQPIEAEAQISSDETNVKFDKLDVSSSFVKIICSGTTELLNYDAYVDLKQFQTELGQFADIGPYQMAGELSSKGQVSIREDKLSAVGTSDVKNIVISSEKATASEPAANVDFSFEIDQTENIIAIDSVKASATLGQVSIKDALLPLNEKATKSMNLPISANNVDLKKVHPFAVLLASFPEQMVLEGTAESSVSISSQNDTYSIVTESTKIKNLKLQYPNQKPFEPGDVSLVFETEINTRQKTINVKKLSLDSQPIKITKGVVEQNVNDGTTTLKGQLDCVYDWSAVSAVAAGFMPEDLTLKGINRLPIDFSSEYPSGQTGKILENLNTRGSLGFDEANYMGLKFGPSEAQVQIQNGYFVLSPFSSTVNGGGFNYAAESDFKQKPAMLTTGPMQIMKDIQINDETSNKLLMYVNPIFVKSVGVSGIANFGCERLAIPLARDQKDNLEILGTISIDKLRLQARGLLGQIFSVIGVSDPSIYLTVHPTKFTLQKGYLRYEDMQVDVGNNPVNFKGVIGLDKSLDMAVTLPYTSAGKTAEVGKETEGKRITLPLKGTLDSPELDTAKFLKEQLKNQLEEQLQKGLKDIFKR